MSQGKPQANSKNYFNRFSEFKSLLNGLQDENDKEFLKVRLPKKLVGDLTLIKEIEHKIDLLNSPAALAAANVNFESPIKTENNDGF